MAHIRIDLVEVKCHDTEDVLGTDEFYILGAVACSGGNAKAILTTPFKIKDDQTCVFPPAEAVVFDEDVSDGETITLVLHAYDEDASKDLEKLEEMRAIWMREIQENNDMLINNDKRAEYVRNLAQNLFMKVMHLEGEDDHLGTLDVVIPTKGDPLEDKFWRLSGGSWLQGAHWDYEVMYRIARS